MSKQRSIIEIIDEMLGVIPASETQFIAELDLLVQAIKAVPQSKTAVGKKIWQFQWERLGDICESNVGQPTKPWHFQLASVIFKKPVAVIMESNERYLKDQA